MKKIISICMVLIMMTSLAGCGIIGGGKIKLEEGQMHVTFTEDGEMTMIVSSEDKELEDDMDIDFDDDEDDIKDDIQDFFDDEFEEFAEMMDLDLEVEVLEVKKEDDYALVTLTFSDFELLFMEFYEELEDMADQYDDIEDLADEMEFVEFKKGEEIDEDDLEDYEDNFVIMLDGGDEGTYYEFPTEILLVDGDAKFERISDTVIFVEDDEVAVVVVEEAIEGEVFDPMAMFGDFDMEDIDLEDTDVDFDFDSSEIHAGGQAEAGDPNNLLPGQFHVMINPDGSYAKNYYILNDDLDWEFDLDASLTQVEISDGIIAYYQDWYGSDISIQNVKKHEDGVYFEMYAKDATMIQYDINSTLEEQASYYEGLEELFNTYDFMDPSRNMVSLEQMEAIIDSNAMWIYDGTNGAYYTFPTAIKVIDGFMTWDLVGDNTIFISDWSYGLVVY